MGILYDLVKEDYGIKGRGRWFRSMDHSSLVVDDEKDLFFFNASGIAGGPFTYLTKVRKMSEENAKEFLSSRVTVISYSVNKYGKQIIVYPELVDAFWENGKSNREYWYKRMLTDDTIDRFRLGYYEGWYTIPIYTNGEFVNFQCRKDEPEKTIKSWYSGLGRFLINSDILKIVNKVFITEGAIDFMLLSQYGIPAISHNGGATGWDNRWIKYFNRQDSVTYIGDNDEAGIIGAKKVAESLGIYRTKIYTFSGYSNKYDTVDFFRDGGTIEDYMRLIHDKAKYSFEL